MVRIIFIVTNLHGYQFQRETNFMQMNNLVSKLSTYLHDDSEKA